MGLAYKILHPSVSVLKQKLYDCYLLARHLVYQYYVDNLYFFHLYFYNIDNAINYDAYSLIQRSNEGHTTFNTGALVRGFLVFVGLSILVMAYIVFRSFR